MKCIQLIIEGSVQGVFFRATAKKVADRIGITGYVKNQEDGSVQTVASGTEEQLKEFTNWCRSGPEHANVTHVAITEIEEHSFSSFEILRRK
ncbi:acylphosphatase [soil metagenome]